MSERRRCVSWDCNRPAEANTCYCWPHLDDMSQRAKRSNEAGAEQAKKETCVYCGESGDSEEKRNLVPVPTKEGWVPWAHQGCIKFEKVAP